MLRYLKCGFRRKSETSNAANLSRLLQEHPLAQHVFNCFGTPTLLFYPADSLQKEFLLLPPYYQVLLLLFSLPLFSPAISYLRETSRQRRFLLLPLSLPFSSILSNGYIITRRQRQEEPRKSRIKSLPLSLLFSLFPCCCCCRYPCSRESEAAEAEVDCCCTEHKYGS